ncbi:MAG: hypothetical protein K2O62_03285, partial [Clostridia bacterium]|nr:hypothetical protein [Clostridia bacterium]
MPTGSIVTHDFVALSSVAPFFQTVGSLSTNTTVNGKFNSTIGSDLASQVDNFSVSFNGNVTETTTGDKLFLLDYDDVINSDYGFVNSASQNLISFYGKSYSGWQTGYYSSNDNGCGAFDGYGFRTTAFNGSYQNTAYWLRPTGRNGYGAGDNGSHVLTIGNAGNVYYINSNNTNLPANAGGAAVGVRPAMVIDGSKIVYVGSGNALSNNDFTGYADYPYAAGAERTFKTYIKNSTYDARSATATAVCIPDENNKLKIIYNDPVRKAGAQIIVALEDKDSTDGNVAYSAKFSVDSSATATARATRTLSLPTFPAGKTIADYKISLIQGTDNGLAYTEEALCAYDVGIEAPKDTEVTYSGSSKWIADLTGDEKKEWINTDIYCNESIMTVAKIEYKSRAEGATFVDVTSDGTANIIDAGTYKITMHLASGYSWTGKTTADKSFNITVKPKVIDPFAPTVDYG